MKALVSVVCVVLFRQGERRLKLLRLCFRPEEEAGGVGGRDGIVQHSTRGRVRCEAGPIRQVWGSFQHDLPLVGHSSQVELE